MIANTKVNITLFRIIEKHKFFGVTVAFITVYSIIFERENRLFKPLWLELCNYDLKLNTG